MSASYAAPSLRDEFLRAIDADDRTVVVRLARDLVDCTNPLPGMTCEQLALPPGSTYASAAAQLLAQYAPPA